jgi:ferritin-like metal-binding protein YciE
MSKHELNDLEGLLKHQLQDLYSAESQIINALPKMEQKASDEKLKKAFKSHLEETKEQQERLKQACIKLSISPGGEKCKAIEGIIKEAEDFLKEDANAEVMDAGLIANAQRVEHYEIAGYGTACHFAKRLGLDDVYKLLAATLEEEKDADEKLNDIAIQYVDEKAL